MPDIETIIKAATEIAYDNNGIRRDRSEEEFLQELNSFIQHKDPEMLKRVELELSELTEEQLQTAVAGEEREIKALNLSGETEELLGDIFNEVV